MISELSPQNNQSACPANGLLSIQVLEHIAEKNRTHRVGREGAPFIVWPIEGSVTITRCQETWQAKTGTVFCSSHEAPIELTITPGTKGYLLTLNSRLILSYNDPCSQRFNPPFFSNCSNPFFAHISKPASLVIETTFNLIIHELSFGDQFHTTTLKALLNILAASLLRETKAQKNLYEPNRNAKLVNDFLSLIEKDYVEKRFVSQYADNLLITPNRLNILVKKVTGYPASHHIHQRIIEEAKRQCRSSITSMKEIAINLGFDDISHFSKFFKKIVGENFSDYRRKIHSAGQPPQQQLNYA